MKINYVRVRVFVFKSLVNVANQSLMNKLILVLFLKKGRHWILLNSTRKKKRISWVEKEFWIFVRVRNFFNFGWCEAGCRFLKWGFHTNN